MGPSVDLPQYGSTTPFVFSTTPSTLSIIKEIELWQDQRVVNLTDGQKDKLMDQVIIDAQNTTIDVSLNPYDFGQQAMTAGRICTLAQALGILSNSFVQTLIGDLKTALMAWMNGTNSPTYKGVLIYQLQYDQTWGGVIVPADAVAAANGCVGPTAYGNSFYNDHLFHYGYIMMALAALEHIGEGLNGTFPNQIQNLIYDVLNPTNDPTFSPKVRHKDFYTGHSWAPGVVPDVNRQLESSGEAVNCYYAGLTLATEISDNAIIPVAGMMLMLELISTESYFTFEAPNSQFGNLSATGGLGQITFFGKNFTLDWQMQPNNYNGRAIGMYGIQSIPVTEISICHVPEFWVEQIVTLDTIYGMPVSLTTGLLGNSYVPAPGQPPVNFDVATEGGFWGAVGMEIQAVDTTNVTNDQIQTMWNSLITSLKPIKAFDSYSNILYWLSTLQRLPSAGLTEIIPEPSMSDSNDIKVKGTVFITPKGLVRTEPEGCCYRKKKVTCLRVDYFLDEIQHDVESIEVRDGKYTIKIKTIELSPVVIGKKSQTLAEKACIQRTNTITLMEYASAKLALARLVCGKAEPSQLFRENNFKLARKVKRSKYNCLVTFLLESKLYRGFKNKREFFQDC